MLDPLRSPERAKKLPERRMDSRPQPWERAAGEPRLGRVRGGGKYFGEKMVRVQIPALEIPKRYGGTTPEGLENLPGWLGALVADQGNAEG